MLKEQSFNTNALYLGPDFFEKEFLNGPEGISQIETTTNGIKGKQFKPVISVNNMQFRE